MSDREELRRLAQAVAEWSNCNKAWLDTSEDVAAAVVGHIDDDGNTYPVVTVDCELYYSGDSLSLAKFYAAANPATVLELLDEIEWLRAVCAKAKEALYAGTMDDFEVAEMLEAATQGGWVHQAKSTPIGWSRSTSPRRTGEQR